MPTTTRTTTDTRRRRFSRTWTSRDRPDLAAFVGDSAGRVRRDDEPAHHAAHGHQRHTAGGRAGGRRAGAGAVVLGYAPHPKRPDAIQRIKAAKSLYDIRLAGEYKSRTVFDDPDALDLLRTFGELGLPVTIHLEYGTDYGGANYPRRDWWYGGTIGALERAVAGCPDTIFIGHGPGWWSHILGRRIL